jgi:citrate synthase
MLIRQSMKALKRRSESTASKELLSAREAAALLDVKLPTLYAYVSRGQLQSAPGLRGPARLYARADVERLKARHRARAGHGAVAAGALRFGEPTLESALTEIAADGPHYRGQAAVELAARGVRFEAVAELLWSGELGSEPWPPYATRARRGEPADPALPYGELAKWVPSSTAMWHALPLAVAALSLRDRARFDAPQAAELRRARRLIRCMAASLAIVRGARQVERALSAESIASTLAIALGAHHRPALCRRLDQLLVLCADHELNASSFAARVAASTGADLYACVGAALGALSGPKHGGASDRVEALAAETGAPSRAPEALYERTRRGDAIPGFGHPLYPDGDPRAAFILAGVRPRTRRGRAVEALAAAMRRARREAPNVDFALVAAAEALGLGPGAAAAIFAVGRSAGWVAHVFEQRQAGYLMRPRARYVGP